MRRFLVLSLFVVATACAFAAAAGCPNAPCGPGGGRGVGEEEEEGEEGGCAATGGYASTPPPGAPTGASCASGQFWQLGDSESELMHPGVDCIRCHSAGEGPHYFFAGTVMNASDDADDCRGADGVTVQIHDANGADHDTTSNSAGNFYFDAAIPAPYTVTLTRAGRTTSMATVQTDGDCLSCHTVTGANGAPGRIVAP